MQLHRITEKITGGAKATGDWIKGKTAEAARTLVGWRPDAMMIGGAGGIAYGAWLVYAPAGFIVGGLLVLLAGVIDSRGAR